MKLLRLRVIDQKNQPDSVLVGFLMVGSIMLVFYQADNSILRTQGIILVWMPIKKSLPHFKKTLYDD